LYTITWIESLQFQMVVLHVKSHKEVEVEISRLSRVDFGLLKKSKAFEFDWSAYSHYDVYKLILKETREILGLMCLEDKSDTAFNCTEIVLLETRPDQRGAGKTYDRIAGCLIAFAAREAFKNGYEGWIFLIAKSQIAQLYHDKYGFEDIGGINTLAIRMASNSRNSMRLIQKYINP